MRITNQNKLTAAIFVFFLSVTTAIAQSSFEITPFTSKMSILGTSNLHDWESDVCDLSGEATIYLDAERIENIENLSFSVPVKSIESGNYIMNSKTYAALKYKEYSQIKYQLKAIEIVDGEIVNSNGFLTIAGITKEIDFPVEFSVTDNKVNVKGSIKFKMTNFNVDPPTALLGTLTTGDDVIISFSINFIKPTS